MAARFGDHGATVGVADQDDGAAECVEDRGYVRCVPVQVAHRAGIVPVPRQVDGDRADAAAGEGGDGAFPAPGTVPGAVDKDGGGRPAGRCDGLPVMPATSASCGARRPCPECPRRRTCLRSVGQRPKRNLKPAWNHGKFQSLAPTSTGSLASSTPNVSRTPSRTVLARASRLAVVASPGLTRASVCLDEIRAPVPVPG